MAEIPLFSGRDTVLPMPVPGSGIELLDPTLYGKGAAAAKGTPSIATSISEGIQGAYEGYQRGRLNEANIAKQEIENQYAPERTQALTTLARAQAIKAQSDADLAPRLADIAEQKAKAEALHADTEANTAKLKNSLIADQLLRRNNAITALNETHSGDFAAGISGLEQNADAVIGAAITRKENGDPSIDPVIDSAITNLPRQARATNDPTLIQRTDEFVRRYQQAKNRQLGFEKNLIGPEGMGAGENQAPLSAALQAGGPTSPQAPVQGPPTEQGRQATADDNLPVVPGPSQQSSFASQNQAGERSPQREGPLTIEERGRQSAQKIVERAAGYRAVNPNLTEDESLKLSQDVQKQEDQLKVLRPDQATDFVEIAAKVKSYRDLAQSANIGFKRLDDWIAKHGDPKFGQGTTWATLTRHAAANTSSDVQKELLDIRGQIEGVGGVYGSYVVRSFGQTGKAMDTDKDQERIAKYSFNPSNSLAQNRSMLAQVNGKAQEWEDTQTIITEMQQAGYTYDEAQMYALRYQSLNPAVKEGKIAAEKSGTGQETDGLEKNDDRKSAFQFLGDISSHFTQPRDDSGRLMNDKAIGQHENPFRGLPHNDLGTPEPSALKDFVYSTQSNPKNIPDRQRTGVNLPTMLRMAQVESSGGQKQTNDQSSAKGVWQILDGTGKELWDKAGFPGPYDPFDVHRNFEMAKMYMNENLDKFNGDTRIALAAYKEGPPTIKKTYDQVMKRDGSAPGWDRLQLFLPDDVRADATDYVNKVMGDKALVGEVDKKKVEEAKTQLLPNPETHAAFDSNISDRGKQEAIALKGVHTLEGAKGTVSGQFAERLFQSLGIQSAMADGISEEDAEVSAPEVTIPEVTMPPAASPTGTPTPTPNSAGAPTPSPAPTPTPAPAPTSTSVVGLEGTPPAPPPSTEGGGIRQTLGNFVQNSPLRHLNLADSPELQSMVLGISNMAMFGQDIKGAAKLSSLLTGVPYEEEVRRLTGIRDALAEENPWFYHSGQGVGLVIGAPAFEAGAAAIKGGVGAARTVAEGGGKVLQTIAELVTKTGTAAPKAGIVDAAKAGFKGAKDFATRDIAEAAAAKEAQLIARETAAETAARRAAGKGVIKTGTDLARIGATVAGTSTLIGSGGDVKEAAGAAVEGGVGGFVLGAGGGLAANTLRFTAKQIPVLKDIAAEVAGYFEGKSSKTKPDFSGAETNIRSTLAVRTADEIKGALDNLKSNNPRVKRLLDALGGGVEAAQKGLYELIYGAPAEAKVAAQKEVRAIEAERSGRVKGQLIEGVSEYKANEARGTSGAGELVQSAKQKLESRDTRLKEKLGASDDRAASSKEAAGTLQAKHDQLEAERTAKAAPLYEKAYQELPDLRTAEKDTVVFQGRKLVKTTSLPGEEFLYPPDPSIPKGFGGTAFEPTYEQLTSQPRAVPGIADPRFAEFLRGQPTIAAAVVKAQRETGGGFLPDNSIQVLKQAAKNLYDTSQAGLGTISRDAGQDAAALRSAMRDPKYGGSELLGKADDAYFERSEGIKAYNTSSVVKLRKIADEAKTGDVTVLPKKLLELDAPALTELKDHFTEAEWKPVEQAIVDHVHQQFAGQAAKVEGKLQSFPNIDKKDLQAKLNVLLGKPKTDSLFREIKAEESYYRNIGRLHGSSAENDMGGHLLGMKMSELKNTFGAMTPEEQGHARAAVAEHVAEQAKGGKTDFSKNREQMDLILGDASPVHKMLAEETQLTKTNEQIQSATNRPPKEDTSNLTAKTVLALRSAANFAVHGVGAIARGITDLGAIIRLNPESKEAMARAVEILTGPDKKAAINFLTRELEARMIEAGQKENLAKVGPWVDAFVAGLKQGTGTVLGTKLVQSRDESGKLFSPVYIESKKKKKQEIEVR